MNINAKLRWSAAAAILLLLCLPIPVFAAGTWVTETISSSDTGPGAADISGSNVVYDVLYNEAINYSTPWPWGVLLYDADAGTTTSLAYVSGTDRTFLGGVQTAGDAVVWFEDAGDAFVLFEDASALDINNSVFLYSLSTGTNMSIRSSPEARWPKTDGSRVVWSEIDDETETSTLLIYDIAAQTTDILPMDPWDASSVVLDSDTIAFVDVNTSALVLYDIPSRKRTVVSVPIRTNTTFRHIHGYAMAGDVLLYNTLTVEDSPKRSFNTLTWYSIKEQTNVTLSPVTGLPVENLTEDDKAATFRMNALFTDGNTLGWALETGISESDFITVNAETGAVSHLKIDGDVAFPSIDGNRAVWVQSKMLKDSHLVLATWQGPAEDEPPETAVPETTSTPGFGILCAAGALAVGVLSFGKKR
ncbi:hypothetical protein L0665_09565 [Methanogenium marinum]|uniref:Uncharacterized protein n=1 Tax=Methanogenium marinum TaxID=348610 RepID=A0A9Q4KU43_9EURY|nr:hypothetical protein [Methanogenium marinum]MDE4908852.1 hypothetical protein [Methanogenium marinum]